MSKKARLKNFWPTYVAAGCTGLYFAYGLFMIFFARFTGWTSFRITGWAIQVLVFAGWAWVMYRYTCARLRHDWAADHFVTKAQEAEDAKERYDTWCRNLAEQMDSMPGYGRMRYEAAPSERRPIKAVVIDPPPAPPEQR